MPYSTVRGCGSIYVRVGEIIFDVGYRLPEPEFKETGTSFVITFRKDIPSEEYLKHIGLNTNQMKATMHLKVSKEITNREYQKLNGVSKSTASRELSALVKRGIIEKRGRTGRGTAYVLKGSNDSETTQKRLNEDIRK